MATNTLLKISIFFSNLNRRIRNLLKCFSPILGFLFLLSSDKIDDIIASLDRFYYTFILVICLMAVSSVLIGIIVWMRSK